MFAPDLLEFFSVVIASRIFSARIGASVSSATGSVSAASSLALARRRLTMRQTMTASTISQMTMTIVSRTQRLSNGSKSPTEMIGPANQTSAEKTIVPRIVNPIHIQKTRVIGGPLPS